MIDWSAYTAEQAFETLQRAPRIASVWHYSELTLGYSRNLLWDPKKGSDVGWLTVAQVWPNPDKGSWFYSYAYDGDAYQRRALGPFKDRFEAARAADAVLVEQGGLVCK